MNTTTKTAGTPPRRPQSMPPKPNPAGAVSYSVRPSRATYLLRRIIVLVPVLGSVAIAAAVVMALQSRPGSEVDPSGQPIAAGQVVDGQIVDGQIVAPAAPPAVDLDPIDPAISAKPDQRAITGAEVSEPAAVVFPPRASQFAAQAPARVLDTRGSAALSANDSVTLGIPGDRRAVALSVSIIGAAGQGVVTIDGRAGRVEAAVAGGPGASTTNLVFVPVVGDELTVRSSTRAHLVVDVVGSFGAPDESGAGRFVATDPNEVARLVTETDGREATVAFDGVVPEGKADAVLVSITADVGADGGVVRLGPDGRFDQMLMWGPAADDNRTRRGLVLLRPGADSSTSLRYEGGSVLTAEVVGYFTGAASIDDGHGRAATGLYLPSGPRTLFRGQLDPLDPTTVSGIPPQAERAMVTNSVLGGPIDGSLGHSGSWLIPAGEGTVALKSTGTTTVEVTLLGVFLGSN